MSGPKVLPNLDITLLFYRMITGLAQAVQPVADYDTITMVVVSVSISQAPDLTA